MEGKNFYNLFPTMISKYRNKANIIAENFTFTNKTNTLKQLPNHKETRQAILI